MGARVMARIRSIHPSLWTDAAFVSLSPFARLLMIGLWGECDDKGCFVWSPIEIKMRLLPADNVDALELLQEIEDAGRVLRYQVEGKEYAVVRNFAKFQRPKSPNDIHPSTEEVMKFAGHKSSNFGNVSEKSSQMEDGGDKGGDKGGDRIVVSWNMMATENKLSVVQKVTDARKTNIRKRLSEFECSEICDAIESIPLSGFLMGKNDRGWKANFDWLLQPSSMTKLIEGSYHNSGSAGRPSGWTS